MAAVENRSWALRVPCPWCGSVEYVTCVTMSGAVAIREHATRWKRWYEERKTRPSRMELLIDDPRFKLAKGDVLVCLPYPNPMASARSAAPTHGGW